VSLQADGSVWSLPGGEVKLALGAQARRETLVRTGANFLSTIAPVPIASIHAGRDVTAAFVEARVPVFGSENARPGFERLELSLAGRVEHYQSFGTTANPKVGVVWQPVHDLELRGSFGTSFRAPALRETGDAPVYTPTMLALGTSRILTLNLGGGNLSLKPETANSWTVGGEYRPSRLPGLTLNVTGYDVGYHNRIDRPVAANLANALTDPTLTSFVTRISPATNPADRALIAALLATPFVNTASGTFAPEAFGAIADNRYVNTSTLHVQGMDVTGSYAFTLGEDRVVLGANATYMFKYDQQITPTSPRLNRANVVGFPERFRARATADWTRGRLTLGGAMNYVNAYRDTLGVKIGDQPTFDLQARLAPADHGALKGISVLLNLRNVFDRDPPFYNNAAGVGYDPANADPIGRFVSLQLTRAW
jgi:outer membrane receptor protein involved in Fe transport